MATTVTEAPEPLLTESVWSGRVYVDGWSDAPETIEVLQPATGAVIASAGAADTATVARAAASAAAA
ncbi:MAG: benzaldehyde dehydrogenase, partial [Solirubrobacteraceae bacterium]